MIARIATEGQYRLEGDHLDHLNELDGRVVDAVSRGDDAGFRQLFAELLTYIRQNGQRLADAELASSDVILPPPDTTLADARELFKGEGVLPG